MSAHYFDLIREMKRNTYNHCLQLVESSKERGIKPAVRLFATTAPIIRKGRSQTPCILQQNRFGARMAIWSQSAGVHRGMYEQSDGE